MNEKFYEDLPDYKSYREKMKRLQSGKKDDHTIDKANLFAMNALDIMEAEIMRLRLLLRYYEQVVEKVQGAIDFMKDIL